MPRIPLARKEAILNKMLSPHPPTVSLLSQQGEYLPDTDTTHQVVQRHADFL
ncbi:MAG: hypothetical protein NVSMB6_21760 [Burkholderiaceae bacterium]